MAAVRVGSSAGAATPGRRTVSPSRTSRPASTTRSTTMAAVAAARSGRSVRLRRSARATAFRTATSGVASPTARSAASSAIDATSGASSPPSMPCRSRRAPGVPAARADTRSAVWRRRATPRGGCGSRTTPPTGGKVVPRRTTNRSPGPQRDRPVETHDARRSAVVERDGVAAAPADRRVDRRRGGVDPPSRAIRDRAARTRQGRDRSRPPSDRPSASSLDAARRPRHRQG